MARQRHPAEGRQCFRSTDAFFRQRKEERTIFMRKAASILSLATILLSSMPVAIAAEAPAEPAVRVGGYGLDVGQCASISSIMEGKR